MALFRYKRRIRRSNIKIVEAPVRALIPASLPPGILIDPSWSLSQKFPPALFFAITNITAPMSMTMPTRFNNGSTGPITHGWSSVWPGGTLGDGQQWKVGCVTCITLISLMQLKNTLPLQDLRVARDSNANWYSVLSKPTTVVLEHLSLPAQHLKCSNLRLSENSSNVLQIFTKNAQEWIQWMSSSLSVRICVIGMLINLKVFVLFVSSWNLQSCNDASTKCRGIFTKIFGLTEGWFWFNLQCLFLVMLLFLLFVFRHQASSGATAGFSLCIHCTTMYILSCWLQIFSGERQIF